MMALFLTVNYGDRANRYLCQLFVEMSLIVASGLMQKLHIFDAFTS
jgi:hypothetical protein